MQHVRPWIIAGVGLVAAGLVAAPVTPMAGTPATVTAPDIQLTATDVVIDFIRHAQSTDNAQYIIGTMPPGAHLTPAGQEQAESLIDSLGGKDYDGIFASWLVRTQETAAPLADHLGMEVQNLAGLNELSAGLLEGIRQGQVTAPLYMAAPMLWMLGLYNVPQIGSTDFNGMAFQDRMDDALKVIYDTSTAEGASGQSAAFSHGATMMAWTLMNVNNATPWLWLTNPLSNIDQVVIEGNPADGWTLISWDGVAQDVTPSLLTQLFVDTRDLIVAPQMASYYVQEAMVQSLQAQDPSIWLAALETGFNDVTQAMLNYPGAVVEDIMSYLNGDIELGWDEWAQGLQVMGGFTMTLAEGMLNSLIPGI